MKKCIVCDERTSPKATTTPHTIHLRSSDWVYGVDMESPLHVIECDNCGTYADSTCTDRNRQVFLRDRKILDNAIRFCTLLNTAVAAGVCNEEYILGNFDF